MKNITDIVPETKQEEQNEFMYKMFDLQRKFGDFCFQKQDITDNEGNVLSFDKIFKEYQEQKFGANDLPNVWLKKFMECIEKESEEIEELLPWKHWSSATMGEEIHPDLTPQERVNMVKIELIDIWHFLMSAFMCLGMGPKEVYELYMSKNKVNIERQQNNYNTAHKTEEDNLNIARS
ncbi:MAG: hypothetical protein ACOCV1_00855 [Bacillota bacterium]